MTVSTTLKQDVLMLRAMVGIGLVCAVILSATYQISEPIIRAKRAEALEKAIFSLLPQASRFAHYGYDRQRGFVLQTAATASAQSGESSLYAAYDDQQRLVGFAVEARGMGYQDTIELLYGYDPHDQHIVGMRVLASRETPGLGSRIETDAGFHEQIQSLDVRLTQDKTAVAHPLEMTKGQSRQHHWQLDAISGATVSSTAVGNILRESTAYWLPKLQNRKEVFERGAAPDHTGQNRP